MFFLILLTAIRKMSIFAVAMTLADLSGLYGGLAQTKALIKELAGKRAGNVFLQGLRASSAPLLFCGVAQNWGKPCILIVLNDQEEAAYFYHDMVQTMGDENVLYFPSAYRRAAKYGQRDDASGILRTEVLSRITTVEPSGQTLVIVSSPDALAETVVSKQSLEDRSIQLHTGESLDRDELQNLLLELGFNRVDYVYEPGQFALRGSILDVFSFSSEYPLRIDFFGDDIDSIRQFSVETQLSTEKKESVVIVPDMNGGAGVEQVSLLDFLPDDTVLAVKDLLLTADRMTTVSNEVADQESLAARMRQLDAGAKITTDGSQQPARPEGTLSQSEATERIANSQQYNAKRSFKVGDTVRLAGQTQVGEVISVNKSDVTVAFGHITTSVKANRLEPAEPVKVQEVRTATYVSKQTHDDIYNRKLAFKPDIDVRGMRGDEAIQTVMHFIDDATLIGMSRVRILHGTGNGILRNLIRQYLHTVPAVKDYHDEHIQFGGHGITVVDLG